MEYLGILGYTAKFRQIAPQRSILLHWTIRIKYLRGLRVAVLNSEMEELVVNASKLQWSELTPSIQLHLFKFFDSTVESLVSSKPLDHLTSEITPVCRMLVKCYK